MAQALNAQSSVLVLVDYQTRLMPAIDQSAAVLREAQWVAEVANALAVPTVRTEQMPDKLGPTVAELARFGAPPLHKHHFNAVADGLLPLLGPRDARETQVVVAGCEAHVCLFQTACGLHSAGYSVNVVADACGSRYASDREMALQRLLQLGVTLVSPEMVAFEWLGTARHPVFARVLPLIKQRGAAA